ncbi:type I 3-dehydroquinate dehydratase [Arthrobacter ginkgonis]|uniref:3-dehydroquinate dehydratase n=1 Tax=Arthrobacter ginkgonis TaxID=1630594 RepID=A0ABP7C9M7_9MICC
MPAPITPVHVKGTPIGEGRPKIVVSVTGRTTAALLEQVDALAGHGVDIVEWRVDHFGALADLESVLAAGRELAARLADIPLLFTCRTSAEGGAAEISAAAYATLNATLAASGLVDLVDVEYERDGAAVERVLAAARAHGVPVVASYHDFGKTPARGEIVARLCAMQEAGFDVCKIAVMPRSAADVLTLLDATRTMHEDHADRPLITMSMGPLGLVSRLAGGLVGSAATFGMVGEASAPGQAPVDELSAALRLLDAGSAVPARG